MRNAPSAAIDLRDPAFELDEHRVELALGVGDERRHAARVGDNRIDLVDDELAHEVMRRHRRRTTASSSARSVFHLER